MEHSWGYPTMPMVDSSIVLHSSYRPLPANIDDCRARLSAEGNNPEWLTSYPASAEEGYITKTLKNPETQNPYIGIKSTMVRIYMLKHDYVL